MDVLLFYCSLYESLHNYKGVPPLILSPLRRLVRIIANKHIPKWLETTSNRSKIQSDIIVSLTSFPARINGVHLVIECMLRQTIMPKKIILWLSLKQFPDKIVPNTLLKLVNDIFEIRFVEEDYRSHKKYYYVMKEYPNDWILIVDDDLFYPSDMIEKMMSARDKHKNSIICRYACIIPDYKKEVPSYSLWPEEIAEESDNIHLFFGSGGGTLIKKDLFAKYLLDIELAIKLTPIADDLWLNAMANLIGTDKFKIKCGLLLPIIKNQNDRLCHENINNGQNDVQIRNLENYFINEQRRIF